ncbi:MAG TPA: IS4 family transposase [Thermoanaerobaculia bacterium]|nr:IS4 family transposase [Thermoanaerobaculia bacterium]
MAFSEQSARGELCSGLRDSPVVSLSLAIEVYFHIMKNGCKVEQLQLQSRDRIEVALALYLIVAWRVLYLTRLGRTVPDLSCKVAFSPQEWRAVYWVSKREKPPSVPLASRKS